MKDFAEIDPNIKDHTREVIELYREGMSMKDIAETTGKKYNAVFSTIKRARERGEVDSHYGNPLKQKYTRDAIVRRYGLKTGTMLPTLCKEASPEVIDGIMKMVVKQGYSSLAEIAVDLLTEAYFEFRKETAQ